MCAPKRSLDRIPRHEARQQHARAALQSVRAVAGDDCAKIAPQVSENRHLKEAADRQLLLILLSLSRKTSPFFLEGLNN